MTTNLVKVFAPATVSNVGPGFDVFGFALEEPGDEVSVELSPGDQVQIQEIDGDNGELPKDPSKNTAGIAAESFIERLGERHQVKLSIRKGMPPGGGIGSSAASAAAVLWALNELFDRPFALHELIELGLRAEEFISGGLHGDNIAPALAGGFVIVRSCSPLDVVSVPIGAELFCALLCPEVVVLTAESRKLLPKELPVAVARDQWANTAAFVAGIAKGDLDLLRRSVEDHFAEPVRAKAIPHFDEIKASALSAGAYGCSVSGSGPAIFAFAESRSQGEEILAAMQGVLRKNSLGSSGYCVRAGAEGARVIKGS